MATLGTTQVASMEVTLFDVITGPHQFSETTSRIDSVVERLLLGLLNAILLCAWAMLARAATATEMTLLRNIVGRVTTPLHMGFGYALAS